MPKSNFPQFPPDPNILFGKEQKSSTSSGQEQISYQKTSASTASVGNEYQFFVYLSNLHNAIIPRMNEYEKNQENLELILHKEKALEEATRRLLSINIILGMILPAVILLIFFLFCWVHAPENVELFFEKYKWIYSGFTLVGLIAFINPIWNIHQYSKRLDSIEKQLKINGNN